MSSEIICPLRALQVAECTAREGFLEKAKLYEDQGNEIYQRFFASDPQWAWSMQQIYLKHAAAIRGLEQRLRG